MAMHQMFNTNEMLQVRRACHRYLRMIQRRETPSSISSLRVCLEVVDEIVKSLSHYVVTPSTLKSFLGVYFKIMG